MISFTHSRLYKDIGSKAFFTMATLLMPLLENEEMSYTGSGSDNGMLVEPKKKSLK